MLVTTKNHVRKLLLIGVVALIAVNQDVNAQDRIKEVGLTFRNLDNFGLTYKTGTQKSLWRFGSLYASGGSYHEVLHDDSDIDQSSFGLGFNIGREYRREIIENLQLRLGFDLSFSWGKYDYESTYSDGSINQLNRRTSYGPGANGVLGLNYVLGEKFVIGAELMPGFGYSFGKTKQQYQNNPETEKDLSGWSFDLSNSSAMLTLAFRFTKD